MRRLLRLTAVGMVALGAVVTALTARMEYAFCVDGPGRGLPFAVTHPAHGEAFLEIPYSGNALEGMMFDGAALLGDVAYWGVVAGAPLALPIVGVAWWRRRRRRAKED